MKILLDECITKRLKSRLPEFQVFTVFEMGWSGLKNGKLMSKAVENSFDIFLTIDKNIQFQQNLDNYEIAIVVLNVSNSKIEYLEELLPNFKNNMSIFLKGNINIVNK